MSRPLLALMMVITLFTTPAMGGGEGLMTVDLSGCEGVKLTQCELAKYLCLDLKMGEELTCEASFVVLQGLGIAPGECWNYADPHALVTLDEIKELVAEIQGAYAEGLARSDGFKVAEGINAFCLSLKGPAALPPGAQGGKGGAAPGAGGK